MTLWDVFDLRVCRACGCTDNDACLSDAGPCSWVEYDLCSSCAPVANQSPVRSGRSHSSSSETLRPTSTGPDGTSSARATRPRESLPSRAPNMARSQLTDRRAHQAAAEPEPPPPPS